MGEWTYYAGSIASLEDGLDVARRFDVMWRGARNRAGALIANVGRLRSGDTLHFVYRSSGRSRYIFQAVIGQPIAAVDGAPAIDRVVGAAAAELAEAGYPEIAAGTMEVIQLLDIQEVADFPLVMSPTNQTALWKGAPSPAPPPEGLPPEPVTGRLVAVSRSALRRVRQAPVSEAGDSRVAVTLQRGSAFFDRYIAVDWSASSVPTLGTDSIWIAEAWWDSEGNWREESARNCATRQEADEHLKTRLALPGRAVIGLDFAFGYPRGFAEKLPGDGEPWLRTATYLDGAIQDSPKNVNNRNEVAAAINRMVGASAGPFWGCHEQASSPYLTVRRVGIFQFPHMGLAEWRFTDRRVRESGTPLLSVWKINQGVSVGGQTLMGIPHLMKLRSAALARDRAFRIWPFETQWAPASDGVTAVEMFPSLIAGMTPAGEIKDRHQVRQCIARFGQLDAAGDLVSRFSQPAALEEDAEVAVRTEEGWIFLA